MSSILLLVGGIILLLFLGVYSLFGKDHPRHNVCFFPRSSLSILLPITVFNSFIILIYYSRRQKWVWYFLLVVDLFLLYPPRGNLTRHRRRILYKG